MSLAVAFFLLAGSGATPSPLPPPNPCDCKDLPRLFEELMEQQTLRDLCKEYLGRKPPPDEEFLSIGEVSDRLTMRLNDFMRGRRAGRQSSGQPAPTSPGTAAPALGTDFLHAECGLLKNEGGEWKPTSAEEVQQTDCSVITDHLLKHERVHQDRCVERFKKDGHGRELLKPSNYLKEDLEAYTEAVKKLRQEIADLARACTWKGSNRRFRKDDGSMVVPTEPEIQKLKDAVKKKAQALRKGARP